MGYQEHYAKVDSRGRIIVPQAFREQISVKTGQYVKLIINDDWDDQFTVANPTRSKK